MSANKRSTDRQAKAGIPYDFYRGKAHQARSDFLAESWVALRRFLGESLAGQIDRMGAAPLENASR